MLLNPNYFYGLLFLLFVTLGAVDVLEEPPTLPGPLDVLDEPFALLEP